MGQELQRRSSGTVARQPDPSWPAVARNTARLWLDRHYRSRANRRRLVLALCALVAMALGAGVTLAFTQPQRGPATPRVSPAAAFQQAAAVRQQAAAWIVGQVASDISVGCDSVMCDVLERDGLPSSRVLTLQQSSPDPLGAPLVVATAVVRNQFGTRLASVYAPLVVASFGSGTNRIEVRYVAPEGSKAFEAELPGYRQQRITAGRQLLNNNHVQASAAARRYLLAGQVDPRLLVTLSTLADLMPLKLIAFDDPSPGADVPLRGAEIGAVASTSLPGMAAFMRAQQEPYAPAVARVTQDASGQHVFIVQYDAPGPLELEGS